MSIDSPYNFVPLADWVHCPPWAAFASHDIPFRDGSCGLIEATLTAHTPIVVGAERVPASNTQPAEVLPFKLPDGTYALPGSSVRGMLRNVVEIAGFGAIGQHTDDSRFSMRDISGSHVSRSYRDAVKNVRAGLLKANENGTNYITPCSMARLEHADLLHFLKQLPNNNLGDGHRHLFARDASAKQKYDTCKKYFSGTLCFSPAPEDNEMIAKSIGQPAGATNSDVFEGLPVFTGQPPNKNKTRDFVFYEPRHKECFQLDPSDWADFLRIHESSDAWGELWKASYERARAIPVFYVPRQNKTSVGLAYMPKIAGDWGVHDLIGNATQDHLAAAAPATDKEKRGYTLAELLFGVLSAENDDGLAGRVQVQHAKAEGNPTPQDLGAAILNSPKPSYFPNYLVQPTTEDNPNALRDDTKQYVTWINTNARTPQHKNPQVRGWKRYPVRDVPPNRALPELEGNDRATARVATRLRGLPPNTAFKVRIQFHNLRTVELGALVWALTWGGDTELRHALGMGKPFGLGQLSAHIDTHMLAPNDRSANPLSLEECRKEFVRYMNETCSERQNVSEWQTTPQMRELLAMADPSAQRRQFKGHLRYPPLSDFRNAKKDGRVLGTYSNIADPRGSRKT